MEHCSAHLPCTALQGTRIVKQTFCNYSDVCLAAALMQGILQSSTNTNQYLVVLLTASQVCSNSTAQAVPSNPSNVQSWLEKAVTAVTNCYIRKAICSHLKRSPGCLQQWYSNSHLEWNLSLTKEDVSFFCLRTSESSSLMCQHKLSPEPTILVNAEPGRSVVSTPAISCLAARALNSCRTAHSPDSLLPGYFSLNPMSEGLPGFMEQFNASQKEKAHGTGKETTGIERLYHILS